MTILLAILPLVVAMLMLAVLQRSGLQTGLATLVVAMLLVLTVPAFHLTLNTLFIAFGTGMATSLLVLIVLFPALFLYHLLHITGSIQVVAQAIAHLCPERSLQVLLLVLGLTPFVESVSGFGVGTVVVIPMLVAIGIEALPAALLGVLGQLAVPWGALAVGTALGADLTGLIPNELGAHTALLTAPLPFGFGLAALAISGGKQAVRRWWFAALLAGSVLVGGEWLFSLIPGIELAGALAGLLTMVALAILSGLTPTQMRTKNEENGSANLSTVEVGLAPGLKTALTLAPSIASPAPSDPTLSPATPKLAYQPRPLWQAVAPYAILTLFLLLTRLIVPVQTWLQTSAILDIPAIQLHLPILYNPGFWVLFTALLSIPLLGIDRKRVQKAGMRTIKQFTPGAIAITCFLAAAQVMSAGGMIMVLGTTASTLGRGYSWIAPWLGGLGGWLTGSNTGGNAMFAQLQREASLKAGLPLIWIMAAQNGAGSIVTMISPARTILAVTTVGLTGKEGYILRKVGPLVLAAIAIIMLLLVSVTW
ncbi:MAG: L-lactate permease [Ktedonobacteraceae bacterium]